MAVCEVRQCELMRYFRGYTFKNVAFSRWFRQSYQPQIEHQRK